MLHNLQKLSVDVIMFDLDNTLFNYDDGEVVAFEKTMAAFGLPMSIYRDYQKINKGLWDMLERGEIEKEVLKIKRFEDLLKGLDSDIVPQVLAHAYLENLSNTSILFEGSRQVLSQLHGKIPLIAVTNGIESVQMRRLEISGFKEVFDAIVISEKIGVNKPHPKMFTMGLEEIGYRGPHSRVLMVGDNYTADIMGAKRLGFKTCWMNYSAKEVDFEMEADVEIREIQSLLLYLDDL